MRFDANQNGEHLSQNVNINPVSGGMNFGAELESVKREGRLLCYSGLGLFRWKELCMKTQRYDVRYSQPGQFRKVLR